MRGLGDVGILGDVPSDYGRPYAGVIAAPYDPSGPLGALTGKALARAQFLTWLKSYNPTLFEKGLEKAEDWKASVAARTGNPAALSGLGAGDTEPTTWWQKATDAFTALGTSYLAYQGQKQVLQMNIQRANAGLPPLDPSTGAPTIRTDVGLSPQLMARLQDTSRWVLYGGLALGAMLVLNNIFGGRRR